MQMQGLPILRIHEYGKLKKNHGQHSMGGGKGGRRGAQKICLRVIKSGYPNISCRSHKPNATLFRKLR